MHSTPSLLPIELLAQGLVLVSWWKPILLILPFIGWLWIVSTVYDKHAARWILPRRPWNTAHLIVGTVALAVALLMPMPSEAAFWVGWGIVILLLVGDLVAYAVVANRDPRVPEKGKIRLDMSTIAEARAAKRAAKQQAKAALAITRPDKSTMEVPQPETPEYEIRIAAEQIYQQAMQARASRAEIEPSGKDQNYVLRVWVDGVPQQMGEPMPAASAAKVMDFWKSAGQLDVNDRRRKLSSEVTVDHDAVRHKIKLTSIGVQNGMKLSMLFDPAEAVTRKPSELGLLDAQMEELRRMVDEQQGVVLVAAPPYSGRTTTMYGILKMHDAYMNNVQTVEAEPQASLEGIRHNVFDPQKEGAEYGTLLRSILRRDPDVVAVGELPDAATAKEAAKADHERTRVYIGLRAENALQAVEIYVKAVGDQAKAAESLHGVVAQKLIRQLCTNCRVPYPPSKDMLQRLGVQPDQAPQLFKKGGQVLIKNKPEVCPVCSGSGYLGQTGIFEVYQMGAEERQLVASGNIAGLRAAFRKKQLPTIQQAAIRKAVDGITSVEEVMRVTASAPAPSGGQKAPAPAAAKQ